MKTWNKFVIPYIKLVKDNDTCNAQEKLTHSMLKIIKPVIVDQLRRLGVKTGQAKITKLNSDSGLEVLVPLKFKERNDLMLTAYLDVGYCYQNVQEMLEARSTRLGVTVIIMKEGEYDDVFSDAYSTWLGDWQGKPVSPYEDDTVVSRDQDPEPGLRKNITDCVSELRGMLSGEQESYEDRRERQRKERAEESAAGLQACPIKKGKIKPCGEAIQNKKCHQECMKAALKVIKARNKN